MSAQAERLRNERRDIQAGAGAGLTLLFASVLIFGLTVGWILAIIVTTLNAVAGVLVVLAIDEHLEGKKQ